LKVAGGAVFLAPDMAQSLAFQKAKGTVSPLGELSSRELEILRQLRNGKSLTEIADLVHLSYKTIANAASALKGKLGAKSLTDLVRIAIEQNIA
jgi:DNA-binding NarL/FixJ family response regulator